MPAFFDSHAHLSSETLYQNAAQILKRAQEKNRQISPTTKAGSCN